MIEYIILSISGIIGSIIVTQLWQHNWFKRQEMKQSFEEKMYKLKKRETRQDKKLATQIKTKSPAVSITDWIDKLRGIDPNLLSEIVDTLGTDKEGEIGGLEEGILQFAKDNPDIVKQFLANLGKKGDTSIYE